MKKNMFFEAPSMLFKTAQEVWKKMAAAEQISLHAVRANKWHLAFTCRYVPAEYVTGVYRHIPGLVTGIAPAQAERISSSTETGKKELNGPGLSTNLLPGKNNNIVQFAAESEGAPRSERKGPAPHISPANHEEQAPLTNAANDRRRQNLTVVKIGGNIIDDEARLASFLQAFAAIPANKILIHGGGKLATMLAERLAVPQKIVDGRRITDAETLKLVTMVYAGYINKNIIALLQANNCNAIGLTGADGNSILAHKRAPGALVANGVSDYGFAGDIDNINTELLQLFLSKNIFPVIAPITHDRNGQLLNTNADTVAREIAKALSAVYQVTLVYSFEKSGVLENAADESSVIKQIDPDLYAQLKNNGTVFKGMIPKLDNAFAAIESGVKKVIIGKAENLHQLLKGEAGTTIVNK